MDSKSLASSSTKKSLKSATSLKSNKAAIDEDCDDKAEETSVAPDKEFEDRQKSIEEWMEKLARVKKEEFEQEEAAMIPMRNYLMENVIPILTKGLIDVTRTRPEDPIDFLAEVLFQNNPGGMHPIIQNGSQTPAPSTTPTPNPTQNPAK